LKIVFRVNDSGNVSTESKIKRKLERLIATRKFTTIAELAKHTGYSDSYVSRVLKHKR